MRLMVACSAWTLFLSIATGQTAPTPMEILRRVSETYSAASQYELLSSVVLRAPDIPGPRTYSTHLWFAAPDKYRLQSSGDFCTGNDTGDCPPGIHELLSVYRIGTLWIYAPGSNEYREHTAPNLPRDTRPEDVDLYMGAGMFRHASAAFANSRFLREERLTTDQGAVDCIILEVATPDGLSSLWIDKSRYYVLRMESGGANDTITASIVYTTIKLDGPLADDLFDFKPPTGARKVDPGTPFGRAANQ
jgi:outer membrane lipoprotein-sorting protein